MSTGYERTFRAEVLKECLAAVSGRFLELGTQEGEDLSFESGVLANQLFKPEYDTDEAIETVEHKLKYYQELYKQMEKGA